MMDTHKSKTYIFLRDYILILTSVSHLMSGNDPCKAINEAHCSKYPTFSELQLYLPEKFLKDLFSSEFSKLSPSVMTLHIWQLFLPLHL